MFQYHIIVTGSRPTKTGNRFDPMPQQNIDFINEVLGRLDAKSYVALYHGAAAGVDTVVDDYAFRNGIRVKQFPAYWFDPTKADNVDRRAGLFRNEQMVRAAVNDATVYDRESKTRSLKPETFIFQLAFYNTNTLADSNGTNHCYEFAGKFDVIQRHAYQMPVLRTVQPTAESPTVKEQVHPF